MQGVLLYIKGLASAKLRVSCIRFLFTKMENVSWDFLASFTFSTSFQGISNFSNGEMDESCGSVYFPTSVNEFNKIMHQLYQHTAKNSPSVMFFSDKTFMGKVNPVHFLCFTFPLRCVTQFLPL